MKIDTTIIEDSIIGTLLMWPERYHDISETIRPFMFSPALRPMADYLFAAIADGEPVELGVVISDAQAQGLATADYLLRVTESPAMDDLKAQAIRLRNAYITRQDSERYAEAHRAIISGARFDEVRSKFEAEAEALDSMVEIKHDRRFDAIREAYAHLVKGLEKEGMSGTPCGYPEIDEHTGGWQPGNFVVMGARPGMGKTTIALDWVYSAASAGHTTMFVSLEMTQTEVLFKLVSKVCAIPPRRLMRSEVSESEPAVVWAGLEKISCLPIFIFDDTNISRDLHGIRDAARRIQRKDGLGLIVIDYLQLMDDVPGQTRKGREERIGDISRGLKRLAKQLQVPIIALSQLSRAVEIRGGTKEPMLSDLRDSGSLEQDGDIVGFFWRPEYYDIKTDDNGNNLEGKVQVSFRKHRMGSPRDFWVDYDWKRDSYLFGAAVEKQQEAGQPTYAIPAGSRPGSDDDIPF